MPWGNGSPRTFQDAAEDILGKPFNDVAEREQFTPEMQNLGIRMRTKDRIDIVCGCGIIVQQWRMVDVGGLPPGLSGGTAFVCDGCWTAWLRADRNQGKPFDDNGTPRRLTKREWVRQHGAPVDVVRRFPTDGQERPGEDQSP